MKTNLSQLLIFVFAIGFNAEAKENKGSIRKRVIPVTQAANCPNTTAQADLAVNNVRARILNGGDMWWDPISQINHYEVPIGSNKYSLYTGALWIGGYDASGVLHVAGQTYRQQGANDFWSGPISKDPVNDSLSITQTRCSQFDRFWSVSKSDVQNFVNGGSPTQDIIDWPGNGNVANGELQFLAPFFDSNNDGLYNHLQGDYPLYNLSPSVPTGGCNDYLLGDQNFWWVFNDIGNIKTETFSDPIGLEIRAQAFACSSANPSLNNSTFYKYQIINRSSVTYTECYIGQWVDPELGNGADDYVGCDVMRGLGFCYNGDPDDNGAAGYGLNPPAVGTDFLQGPLADINDLIDNNMNGVTDEPGEECTMAKFVYYQNLNASDVGNPQTTDDYYQYLSGIWLDGLLITYGSDGRDQTNPPANFMFPGTTDPAFPGNNWTMFFAGLAPTDMRYLQSAGRFTLDPGEVDYATIATVWARDSAGGSMPSLAALQNADDDAQALFNNCFIPVGIDENESVLNINCFPNPFSQQSIINFNNIHHTNITLKVFNLKGKLVRTMETKGDSFLLERNELDSGVYLIQLLSGNKSVYSGKIVIQ